MLSVKAAQNFMNKFQQNIFVTKKTFRTSSDVVVVGGGAMGASVAYWLKKKTENSNTNMKVVVIEKDPTYAQCSTSLSAGGIRQQYSLPENIELSLYGFEFLKNIKKHFGSDADVSFNPNGYLILSNENNSEEVAKNHQLQLQLGASNQLLSKNQLKNKYPWLNVDGVEIGCLGTDKEGWFDPWCLLSLFKAEATKKGVQFLTGEVINFVCGENGTLKGVSVILPNGKIESVSFNKCVIAAGADSGEVAKLAKIGTGPDILSVALPVERRKRYIYRFDCQGNNAPQLGSPFFIDFTGAYFRRDGDCFLGGISPGPDEEPNTDNLDVDYDFFDNRVWPLLAHRIPAFEKIKVKSAWGGFYEHNCFDENGIVGSHPHYQNLYFATGFSGHGIQQSPATGLAVAELILDGRFKTIDLSRMGFDRLVNNKPIYERAIY